MARRTTSKKVPPRTDRTRCVVCRTVRTHGLSTSPHVAPGQL